MRKKADLYLKSLNRAGIEQLKMEPGDKCVWKWQEFLKQTERLPGIGCDRSFNLRGMKKIRKKSYVPILFLTAKAQESDKLLGLMARGDDYLSKPFSYAELLGRVKAQIRRYTVYNHFQNESEHQEKAEYIKSGGIQIHTSFNEVTVDGKAVELTEVHIRKLRVKIEPNNQEPTYIKTVWGKGYRFEGEK